MGFFEFFETLRNFYDASNENHPLVLTLVNADGTVSAYEVDSAGLLNTGHPNGSGTRVNNLIIYPAR